MGRASIGLLALLFAGACSAQDEATAPGRTSMSTAASAVETVTVTETVAGAGPTAAKGSRANRSTAKAVNFRGNGDRRLPPLRVRRGGTVLRWTNSGEVFSLFSAEGTLVDSVAHRGGTYLEGGVHRIDVVASGSWVIRIPRARLRR